MKRTILENLYFWSEFQRDRAIDFNGYFWVRSGGNILIDPPPLDEAGVAFVREKGGARWILLTNADHWRAADSLRAAFMPRSWHRPPIATCSPARGARRISGASASAGYPPSSART